jgi:hypothetical protein
MIPIPIQAPIAPKPMIKPQAKATNDKSVMTISLKVIIKNENQKT